MTYSVNLLVPPVVIFNIVYSLTGSIMTMCYKYGITAFYIQFSGKANPVQTFIFRSISPLLCSLYLIDVLQHLATLDGFFTSLTLLWQRMTS